MMVEVSVMASSSFALRSFRPDPLQQQHHGGGLCRLPFKEFQHSLPSQFMGEKDMGSNFLTVSSSHCVDYQKLKLSSNCNQIIEPASSVLVDIKDYHHPDSVLFSYGIAEQCLRREKILRFLTSGSNVSNGGDTDFSVLRDLMGLHTLAIAMQPLPDLHLEDKFGLCDTGNVVQAPLHLQWKSPSRFLMNYIDNMPNHSMTTINADGQVLSIGTEDEIKKLLSIMTKVYMSQNGSTNIHRHQMVVPYFRRSGRKAHSNSQAFPKAQTAILAPSKSLDKAKAGAFPKKKQKKKQGIEREACKNNNYSQICEGLLSVILIRNQNEMALYSLKKHGNELPGLLMQFSAGIAGAGLAVLFSVAWKITNGRMPLCTTKLLNTGFGMGLLWLSSAVNMLRDTILDITKSANKLRLKDAETTDKVERSVKEVLFRAAAVMALVVFRFA